MTAPQGSNDLIKSTLNKISAVENIADWSDLDRVIGQLGTISGLAMNDTDIMTTVMTILDKLCENPHHNHVTIRNLAVVLNNIITKNLKYIPVIVELIDKMVRVPQNDQNSLIALYHALGNAVAFGALDCRRRVLLILSGAPWHPGSTSLSINTADAITRGILAKNPLNKTTER